jgi:hypothetical protein
VFNKIKSLLLKNNLMASDIDPQQTLREALDNFGKELQKVTVDLRAIEILTAVGETTVRIEKTVDNKDFDITALANADGKKDVIEI